MFEEEDRVLLCSPDQLGIGYGVQLHLVLLVDGCHEFEAKPQNKGNAVSVSLVSSLVLYFEIGS